MTPDKPLPGHGLYFTTAQSKFILLSICTCGLYYVYWFWKNWQIYNTRSEKNIWPWARAMFSVIWAYFLFQDVKDRAKEFNVTCTFQPGYMAVIYVILFLLHNSESIYWLLTYLAFLPLLAVNEVATQINKKTTPGFVENDRFTFWSWMIVLFGGLLNASAIAGTIFPELMQQPAVIE